MNQHAITWTQPSPFWSESTTQLAGVAAAEFRRPAILRFATDSFMDEFLNVLATDPRRLGEYRVRRETWRGFLAPAQPPLEPKKAFALPFQRLGAAKKDFKNGEPSLPTKPPESSAINLPPLKLYGAAAQRYYLVTSCLVCRMPGLPDRHVEPAREERVSFLVRRLFAPAGGAALPKEEWDEHAWVPTAGGNFWRKLDRNKASELAPGEERLPMFGLNFTDDDLRQRRLFAGLIPVGKREAYLGGAVSTSATSPGATVKTARKILFRKEIAEPWKALIARAASVATQLKMPEPPPHDPDEVPDRPPNDDERKARLDIERAYIQTVSWLILLDFDRFLREYLSGVHDTVHGRTPIEPLTPEQAALATALGQMKVETGLAGELTAGTNIKTVASSMANALMRIESFASTLEAVETDYVRGAASTGWPDFLFPLADPKLPAEAPLPPSSVANLTAEEAAALAETADTSDNDPNPERVDNLTVLVVRALPAVSSAPEPAVPPAAIEPKDPLTGWFVLRCAYERPACGPLHEDVLSPVTEPFQLAGFFDPDAPARPIRIGLPIDISPAGLRKFDKNTAFVMSDMLCGQVKRMKGLTLGDLVRSVLPWPLHKDLPAGGGQPCKTGGGINIGTVCSLSIPIITICALILLIIIVTLFDIIFRWLPYFIICFPVPGLKAKSS